MVSNLLGLVNTGQARPGHCKATLILALEWESLCDLESMLLVRWRDGARWSLHRNEPAWVVGEQRQLVFATLPCLVSPVVAPVADVGEFSGGISTFM
ncbi:hypothetical protein Vadar_005156 [Vaccinium darrowii]|uniref:Uncharacterized protein n=1 Tax=Vaccinium darrowii TaxID=229202 RepID=A0ACB7WYJ4_9ERIC|nr:hypothetical protein Vadar_005156 [Vaccinium darrowii]